MKTKTKESPAKPAKKSAGKPRVEIHVHPAKVEFFNPGEAECFDRVPNGALGSDADAEFAKRLVKLKRSHEVALKYFDVQGHEITP